MAVIGPEDIGGDDDLARRVLTYARTIAPIDTIVDYEAKKDVIAILRAIAGEVEARGSRHVLTERAGMEIVTYSPAQSWFSDDDRGALRTLCGVNPGSVRTPVGHFPLPDREARKVFRRELYDT